MEHILEVEIAVSFFMRVDDNTCRTSREVNTVIAPYNCLVSKGGLQCEYSIWGKHFVNQGRVRIISSRYMMIIELYTQE